MITTGAVEPPPSAPEVVVVMNERSALGRYGEDLAARRLREHGMTVLQRNWRCAEGEIDIVARDGETLVVCEVKTRRDGGAGRPLAEHPMAAVGPRKLARLHRLAERWLVECWYSRYGRAPGGGVRIDLVGVLLPRRGMAVVEHARGVV